MVLFGFIVNTNHKQHRKRKDTRRPVCRCNFFFTAQFWLKHKNRFPKCRHNVHKCICASKVFDPNKNAIYGFDRCKARTNHICICKNNVDACKSANHVCICRVNKFAECKSDTHDCVCSTFSLNQRKMCRAEHECSCGHAGVSPEGYGCNASQHKCICTKKIVCFCSDFDMDHESECLIEMGPAFCLSDDHDCVCSSRKDYKGPENCKSTINHPCSCRQSGPLRCLSVNKHYCSCSEFSPFRCLSVDTHYCSCPNYGPDSCIATPYLNCIYHECSCLKSVEKCLCTYKHKCSCYDHGADTCKADKKHYCSCRTDPKKCLNTDDKYHWCVCNKLVLDCKKSGGHNCSCKQSPDSCKKTEYHECSCKTSSITCKANCEHYCLLFYNSQMPKNIYDKRQYLCRCRWHKKDNIVDTIWEEWIMETNEFNSFIQWLPQEMVEDTMGLWLNS